MSVYFFAVNNIQQSFYDGYVKFLRCEGITLAGKLVTYSGKLGCLHAVIMLD